MSVDQLPVETIVAIAAILALTVYFHLKYTQQSVEHGPTILTTSGIFATFLGIAFGLMDFDIERIQESLPALIGGMKTAFWGSVIGVGGALSLKGRQLLTAGSAEPVGTGDDGQVTGEDLANLLKSIQQSLVGSDDSTLITQLKLSRQENNDRLDALKRAQTEALEKLSELGSKTLIEALKDVIRDFNHNLTDQFGENFKHLNEAVGKLLTWQDKYKQHIEHVSEQLNSITESMTASSDRYRELVSRSETFANTADRLSDVLQGLETQRIALVGTMEILSRLISAASSDIPKIEAKISAVVDQMTAAVLKSQSDVNRALTDQSTQINDTVRQAGQGMAQTIREVAASMRMSLEGMDNVLIQVGKQIQQTVEVSGKEIAKSHVDVTTALKSSVKDMQEALMDSAEQLHTSVDETGSNLTKLHEEVGGNIQRSLNDVQQALKDGTKQLQTSVESCGRDLVKTNTDVSKNVVALIADTNKAVSDVSSQLRSVVEAVGKDLSKVNADVSREMLANTAKTREQIAALDAALAEELKKSLESLGRQLAALSEKFVRDYGPLTDKLREIVQIASRSQ